MSKSRTKWVLMRMPVSGGRADGRPWPESGSDEPIEVPEDEADDLIRGGLADEADPPGSEPAPEPADGDPEPVLEDTVYRDDLDKAVGDLPAAPAAERAEPPKTADSKQDWVDYAVSRGADSSEADGMTKAELTEKYGR
jgi:hypothetical protein